MLPSLYGFRKGSFSRILSSSALFFNRVKFSVIWIALKLRLNKPCIDSFTMSVWPRRNDGKSRKKKLTDCVAGNPQSHQIERARMWITKLASTRDVSTWLPFVSLYLLRFCWTRSNEKGLQNNRVCVSVTSKTSLPFGTLEKEMKGTFLDSCTFSHDSLFFFFKPRDSWRRKKRLRIKWLDICWFPLLCVWPEGNQGIWGLRKRHFFMEGPFLMFPRGSLVIILGLLVYDLIMGH